MGAVLELFVHSLEHAIEDSLILVPFLFLTYLAMEALEHGLSDKSARAVQRAGVAGPATGAVLGIVPQCGFSAAAATLYAGRVVSLGTLFAVFLSTSDEMLPILIAEQAPIGFIARVLAAKIVVGMVAGFAVDAVARLLRRPADELRIHELCERDHCGCEHDGSAAQGAALAQEACEGEHGRAACEGEVACEGDAHDHAHDAAHAHDHSHGGAWHIVRSALVHTLQVTLFVFLATFALELIIDTVGEDALASFMSGNEALSIVAAALVGLIPNCAASVIITELYLEGALGAGAMIAGLLVSAGIGLLVLFRTNRPMRENIAIACGLFLIGLTVGGIFSAANVIF